MSPNTSDALVSTLSTAPTTSIRPACTASRDSRTKRNAQTTMATPSGMLMPNAQRHENDVVSHPPSSGPTATMPPMVDPQTANAMPRSRPVKFALTSDSVVGRTIAPPTPWTMRASTSSSPVGASAASTDAAANTATPVTMRSRRPSRSASEPNTSSSAANTRV